MKLVLLILVMLQVSVCRSQTLAEMKNEYESLLSKKYILLPHKGTYLNPISYNDNPNHKSYQQLTDNPKYGDRGAFNKNLETEFQISFLVLASSNIFGSKINTFLGYTHHAFWQLYNKEWSRPFRETNYMPEFFGRYILEKPSDFLGIKLLAYDFGIVHESNGQIQELSRSWNRVFVRGVFLSGRTLLRLSLWHRLPESEENDENPNIYQFKGYGELDIVYKFDRENISLKLIPGTEHLSAEFAMSTPWREGLRFYSKLSHGYGLSLQDYDHQNRKFGIGIILADPFSSKPKTN